MWDRSVGGRRVFVLSLKRFPTSSDSAIEKSLRLDSRGTMAMMDASRSSIDTMSGSTSGASVVSNSSMISFSGSGSKRSITLMMSCLSAEIPCGGD
jgi:hypothetical protein